MKGVFIKDKLVMESFLNVKQCFLCQKYTEYFCHTCQQDLCQHCKAVHVIDLDTKHHEVKIYRNKLERLPKHEKCVMHRKRIFKKYCETCKLPVCDSCSDPNFKKNRLLSWFSPNKHRKHKLLDIMTAYKTMREQHKDWLHNMRSETLYKARAQLNKFPSYVNTDIQTCHSTIIRCQCEIILKGQKVKNMLDNVIRHKINTYRCLLLLQPKRMDQHIARIQNFEDEYEQSAIRPVTFLRFIKKKRFPQIQDTPPHCQILQTQKINIEEIVKFMSDIRINKRGKRSLQVENELLLTLVASPVLQKSVEIAGVRLCGHISSMTPDLIWVSDYNKLILVDTTNGDELHKVDDSLHDSGCGNHTVNSAHELVYIVQENIYKLSNDTKKTILHIKNRDSTWLPKSLYCSPSTGDLLVGMWRYDKDGLKFTGKVMRYDITGKCIQTITSKNRNKIPYQNPIYVQENNNGDILVSDKDRGVVVTSREGIFRFFYTGRTPSEIGLFRPAGLCTDALSHILVCDTMSETVEILSRDGKFLKYLLTKEQTLLDDTYAISLSYDFHTQHLWIGKRDCQLCVYRHLNRDLSLIGKYD